MSAGLDSANQVADEHGQGALLNAIAVTAAKHEQFEDAAVHFKQALEVLRRQGHQQGIAACLVNLGNLYMRLDRFDEGIAALEEAIPLTESIRRWLLVCFGYHALAEVHLAQGRFETARELLLKTLELYPENDHGKGDVLNDLARAYSGLGDVELAVATREQGLRDIRAAADRPQEAHALEHQADDLERLGRSEEAREYLSAAEAILSDLGHPRAGELRDRLARAAG